MLKSILKYFISLILFFSYMTLYPATNATNSVDTENFPSLSQKNDLSVTAIFDDAIDSFVKPVTTINYQKIVPALKEKSKVYRKNNRMDLYQIKISKTGNLIINQNYHLDINFLYPKLIDKSNHNCFLI
jgi:hypothetical protein